MPRLQDKQCIVTGAGRGIGAAIATAFVAEGARVVVTDRDTAAARSVAGALGTEMAELDVAREDHWGTLAALYPEIDVLVNNAGVTGLEAGGAAHDPEHASLADWRAVHRVNLDGTFLGCRYAIRAMRPRKAGSIINIASRSGRIGVPGAAAYAASKAAVCNHTRSVALYCAGQGLDIRCNAILPGAVATGIWEPMLGDGPQREQRRAALVADTPLRRFAEPAEIAALAVLLASDEAAYMTGTELAIDGGLSAGSG